MIKKYKYIKIVLVNILFIFSSLFSYAGTEVLTSRLQGVDLSSTSTLEVQDDKHNILPFNPNIINKNVINTITLGIDASSSIFHSTAFTITVDVDVSYMDKNFISHNLGVKTLTVNYNPNNGTSYLDKDVLIFSGGHSVAAKVLSISDGTNTLTVAPDDIYLSSTIEIERYYPFSSQDIPDYNNIQHQLLHNNSRELTVTWDKIEGAEEYDLEWTWVNDYNGVGGTLSSTNIDYDFKNNATRVRTANTRYSIPLVYESGWILYRYRAIGVLGTDFSILIEGVWSTENTNVPSSGKVFDYTNNKYPVSEHNNDQINWQYSATFAEKGKQSSAVSYYDGTLRNRQSVAKLNTENKVIAGSVLYDFQGRPAVNVLPTPIYKDPMNTDPSGGQLSGYIENLNKRDWTNNYNKNDFDIDLNTDCETNLTPMDASASKGAANYYSNQNPNKEGAQAFLPNAFGYPFVRTEYTNDQTGRVRRQGGLGNTHQLGNEHETKYLYSQPFQEEIDVLFGNEVGGANHYKKNAVMDANKQLSISYIDMHDRVVATALAGQSPSNKSIDLINLDSYAAPGPMSANLMQFNTPSSDGRAKEVRYNLLSTGGTYDFDYTFDTETYTDCLPGGNTIINSSYEHDDTYLFDDNSFIGMLKNAPYPVHSGIKSIYQEYPSTELGPAIRTLILETDEVTNTSVWANITVSGVSGSLFRALTDVNGDILYYDNANAQPVLEEAVGITTINNWTKIQFASNLTVGPTYYDNTGTLLTATDDIYLEVYTRVQSSNSGTYFDDINIEILNNSNPLGFCFDCIYEVTLSIKDECGNEMIPGGPITEMVGNLTPYSSNPLDANGNVIFDIDCDPQINYEITPNPIAVPLLKVGTYTVYKSLRVSDNPVAYYKQQFREYNTCGQTYQDILAQQIAAIDLSGCDIDPCEYESLLIYADWDAYIADGHTGAAEPIYLAWKTDFIIDCHNDIIDPCKQMLQLLETDFFPGGQYAEFGRNATTGNVEYTADPNDEWSIFRDPSISPNNLPRPYSLIANWGTITANTPNGAVSPSALTVAEFVFYFQPSWIEYLVQTHPEYCNYTFCTNNQVAYDFIEDFRKTNSFGEACTKGYLNPTGLSLSTSVLSASCNQVSISPNPFIIIPSGGSSMSIEGGINNYLNNINPPQGVKTIWEVAIEAATGSTAGFPIGNNICNDADVWNIFRALFIAEFSRIIESHKCTPSIHSSKIQKIRPLSSVLNDPNLPGNSPPLNGVPLTPAQSTAAINTHINSICTGYADSWIIALQQCGWITPSNWLPTGTSPTTQDIKNVFIDICRNGSIDNTGAAPVLIHPNGSRTCYGDPVILANGETFENIEQVITYFTGGGTNNECTALLINEPNEVTLSTLDDCGCDKILQTRYNYDIEINAGTLPAWINSPSDYLAEEDGITVLNFEKLECVCNDAFGTPVWDYNTSLTNSNYWNTTQIANLTTEALPVDQALTCETCIPCEDYDQGVLDFADDYPSLVGTSNYNELLATYLNQTFNISMVAPDYIDFAALCENGGSGGVVPNQTAIDNLEAVLNFIVTNLNSTFSQQIVTDFSEPAIANYLSPLQIPGCSYPPSTVVTIYINISPVSSVIIFQTHDEVNGECRFSCRVHLDIGLTYNIPIVIYNPCDSIDVDSDGSMGNVDFKILESCTNLCESVPPLCYTPEITPEPPTEDPCIAELISQATYNAQVLYDQYMNDALSKFVADYYSKCMQAQETFKVDYEGNEHHYTLYYYDQAGNLTQTVPPKAVVKLADNVAVEAHRADPTNAAVYPNHTSALATTYKYNAYNQVIEQTTPDGGTTHYWYDKIGRLKASQNQKQANYSPQRYSYTSYDEHGRIVEVGELESGPALINSVAVVNDPGFPAYWLSLLTNPKVYQVTKTYYDEPLSGVPAGAFGANGQQNLRNRIASVTYQEDYNANSLIYDNATHYSYDEHGNVITSVQENKDLIVLQNNFKRTDYKYELISGNIIEVAYQKGEPDQFFHQYFYDADNRLFEVNTSKDYVIWDRDAKYKYYEHGPLARLETGDVQVQGTDYAYTIQGWLKGINSNTLVADRDIGKDGIKNNTLNPYMSTEPNQHALIARDAFGFSLDYFSGDYAAIKPPSVSTNFLAETAVADPYATRTYKELFNGNITGLTNTITKPDGSNMSTMRYAYRYDQLNRLKQMDAYTGIVGAGGYLDATITDDYFVHLNYDDNGNITNLTRNAFAAGTSGLAMDNMDYTYTTGTNRLDFVFDNVTTSNYNDIKDGQTTLNYEYTDIGELKKDVAEQIENIEWTVYGKVKRVIRNSDPIITPATSKPSDLEFVYGPSGQRITKIEKPRNTDGLLTYQESWIYTYYSYDASGNLMGTYNKKYTAMNQSGTMLKEEFTHNESPIYGSSRLGLTKRNLNIAERKFIITGHNGDNQFIEQQTSLGPPIFASVDPDHTSRILGDKMYELTNHLGNVQVVVADRKFAIEESGSTGIIDHYTADVVSASDYYPFGSLMPGRNFSSSSYRFGFNGMEKDDEMHNTSGSSYDFGERIYDARLGKFTSMDPKDRYLPSLSPYSYAANNPIYFMDEEGEFPVAWLVKYGANVGIDIASQMVMAYAFGDANTVGEMWDDVSLTSALWDSGLDMLNNKKLRMALAAGGEILDYLLDTPQDNWTVEGVVTAGALGLMEPLMGDALAKYGVKAVVKGLKKLGASPTMIKRVTGVDVNESVSSKSNKTLGIPEWEGPVNYGDLVTTTKTRVKIGEGKNFTALQKSEILAANRKANGGYLRSDLDGTILDAPVQSKSGVPANMNQAEIDHFNPKSNNGDNSFGNAQVLSKKQNLKKGGKKKKKKKKKKKNGNSTTPATKRTDGSTKPVRRKGKTIQH
ncbi:MAG: hypothetical protein COB15_08570 [Flavobacteriales bacterium]|nr:MAG: hypothetical protein COB15_08570 [Flavobacteriales bacterium]